MFPPYQPVTAQNMNYASLVLGATLLFGMFYWPTWARKQYSGPLTETEGVATRASGSGTKQERVQGVV